MSRRPCDLDWIRDIRSQCEIAGVPFFLKQIVANGRIDKSSILDGKEWRQFPVELTDPVRVPPTAPAEPISAARSPEPPAPNSPAPTVPAADFTLMSDVVAKPVEWLWPLYVPAGELTLFDGDPSTNKSSLTLDLAARISTGATMPDGTSAKQGGVLLLVGEDSIAKTLQLRLHAAGADLDRVGCITKAISLPDDLDAVARAAMKMSARMIVIDPLTVFLGRNANNDQAVRQALTPLRHFAERSNISVVMIRHLNKSGGRRALYRGSGSIGIVAAVRSAFLVGKHPEDSNLRVLCQTKNNLGPMAPSLIFEPVTADNGAVRIEWRGECDLTADHLLVPSQGSGNRLNVAEAFLTAVLASGPVEQVEIQRQAAAQAIAYRTVERAKRLLGITSRREGFGPGSVVLWEFPSIDSPTEVGS